MAWIRALGAPASSELIIYNAGVQLKPLSNGMYSTSTSYTCVGGATFGANSFSIANTGLSDNQCRTVITTNAFDLSKYSAVNIETDRGTFSLDISAVNTNGYINVVSFQYGGGMKYITLGASSQQSNMETNKLVNSIALVSNQAVTLTVTKLWLS